jgi:prepilin-type N-terminal cleavage/methylation domain-containing protein
MPDAPLQRSAFSLLELLIVLVLVGIISAIAVPRYASSLDNYRASVAARKVAADLAMTQSSARAGSRAQTLAFVSSGQSYRVEGLAALDGVPDRYAVNLSEPPYSSRATVDFAGTLSVTFDGYGTPSSGGTVLLRSGQARRTVTLDAHTGACRID